MSPEKQFGVYQWFALELKHLATFQDLSMAFGYLLQEIATQDPMEPVFKREAKMFAVAQLPTSFDIAPLSEEPLTISSPWVCRIGIAINGAVSIHMDESNSLKELCDVISKLSATPTPQVCK